MAVWSHVTEMYHSLMGHKPKKDYTNYLGGALIAALVLGGLYYGYGWYATNREQAAQKVLAECLQEYAMAQVGGEPWASVEQLCKLGYEQHSGSSLAPYFIAMQSDALLKQDKKDEAFAVLDTMLNKLSRRSALYPLYATKRALMLIDMGNEAQQKTGLEQLTALAHDTGNAQRDMALYYLGLYNWMNDKEADARKEWQDLLKLAEKDQQVMSPWAQLAQAKLQ